MPRPSLHLAALALALVACQAVPPEDSGSSASGDTTESGTTTGGGTTTTTTTDGGGGGPEYKCDPADYLSCGEGKKCTALLRGGRQDVYECVHDDGAVNLYDPCTPSPQDGQDRCSPGSICQPTAIDGSVGLCMPLCAKTSECGGGACEPNPFNNVPSCGDACDPLAPLCPSVLRCRRADDRFACQVNTEVDVGEVTAQCLPEGDRGCSEGHVCEAGALIPSCASPTGYCCTPVCELGDADPCGVPATCNPIFTSPAPGFEWAGACYVPQ